MLMPLGDISPMAGNPVSCLLSIFTLSCTPRALSARFDNWSLNQSLSWIAVDNIQLRDKVKPYVSHWISIRGFANWLLIVFEKES